MALLLGTTIADRHVLGNYIPKTIEGRISAPATFSFLKWRILPGSRELKNHDDDRK